MVVSEIMTTHPITIKPDRPVSDALSTMLEIRCHHLPVMSQNNHLIGLVSDYDCHKILSNHATKFGRKAKAAQIVRIRDVMTAAPAVIAPEASVIDAAKLMFENNIRCLPVMRDETLVGIVTTSDLLIAFITSDQQ
ncbi:MAG: CBS domain-containing protein [Aggregatilineales bacterium]